MDAIDVDEVIFNLKATITSSKGGVPLKSIESDYYNINGTTIPFRELGYSSLKQFFQSYKVFKIDESKYETIVNVVSDAKTQHLQDMIKKQKTSKKSKCKRKPKIIHKKFPNDYRTYSKQPTFKKKVPIVSNIRNHTSASSSINTLSSKWIKNDELPTYKRNVTTVSNINNYTSAVSSTNTQNSKWPKKDELSNNKIKVTEVSGINNYTSNVSSINTTNSRWPTNNEMNKNKVINKSPVVSTKITSLPSYTQKKENPLFQSNKEKNMNIGNVRCNNVQSKPKKVMKLFGQSAQDRLQKYVKKDISEIELKSYPIKPIISTDHNYLNQKISELKITHDNVNETSIIDSPITLSTNQPEHFNNEIKQLQIQSKCKMTAVVTAIYSLTDIWVILDETEKNASFWKLQNELNMTMELNDLSPINKDPIVGYFYALYHQQKWHRVSIECIDCDDSIICFFIDSGKSVHTTKNQIYPLESKYFNIPGQAVNILLNKFKLFNDFPLIKDILTETLIDKKFLLIPNNVITTPQSVILYDVETMINVNDKILSTFFEKITSRFLSSIEYNFTTAKVLSILNGFVYLQTNNDVVKSLENLLLTDLFSTGYIKNCRDIDYKNVYITTFKLNIKGRVKVSHFIDDFMVKIFFIDYGVYRNVEVQDLIDINKIDNLIARIPPQAVKTILHMFPPQDVSDKMITEIFDILGDNRNVSVIGVNNLNSNIPCVQLWNIFPDTYNINMVLYTRMEKLKNNNEKNNDII